MTSAATGGRGLASTGRLTGAATRPLLGLLAVAVLAAIVVVCTGLFQGRFTDTVPLTVLSPRAGLVMNVDAKVKLLGVDIGRVDSIEALPDGRAAIRLAIEPGQLRQIPGNSHVDISSPTVFGAKSVEFVPPAVASPDALRPGQVLDAHYVTVEFNTIFERLTSLLSKIDPGKLNVTLQAVSTALAGRGHQIGQTIADLDHLLAHLEPGLPNLTRDLTTAPAVLRSYADAASDLLAGIQNTTQLSQTLIDQQHQLDLLLLSAIGLADTGNDVVGGNAQSLSQVMHLLVPTTDLTDQYHPALTCGLGGLFQMAITPPFPEASAVSSSGLLLGRERYRYPSNLPKVAATGGPQCVGLPLVPFGVNPPLVVADVGTNPGGYGNPGNMGNFDGLKQLLYGPIDGPPRNSAQVGQPG
jgi:phospholipid/cholesterol/gamma-HCH transport system substrate-binding protein